MGTQGPQGIMGHQGFQGTQGPSGGPQGVQGPQGFQGVAGGIGSQGFQGATGSQGALGIGPISVYQGPYDPSRAYYYNAQRRDIVSYAGHYYLANNPAKDGNTNWGAPTGQDWTGFGAEFSSVATALLLAENAVIVKALVMGQQGTDVGLIMSANYVSRTSGFYMDATGFAEFNQLLIRGSISTASAVFNPEQPTNTMPSTSVTVFDPGLINVDTFPANGYLIPMLAFQGWLLGSPGYSNLRFGRSDPRFIVTGNAGFSGMTSTNFGSVELMYSTSGNVLSTATFTDQRLRIETVGTTDWVALGAASNTVGEFFIRNGSAGGGTGTCSLWGQINPIEASTHAPNTFVNVTDAIALAGLTGVDTVRFGLNFKSNNAAVEIVRAKITVSCFNF